MDIHCHFNANLNITSLQMTFASPGYLIEDTIDLFTEDKKVV